MAEADAGGGGADEEEEEEEDVGEPEDDFNAAWEVLDLARAIYEKQKEEDEDEEITLKLADTYIALGDISLETGAYFWTVSPHASFSPCQRSYTSLESTVLTCLPQYREIRTRDLRLYLRSRPQVFPSPPLLPSAR